MRTWYLLSVWIHLLGAIVWIGGMAFLGAVLVPVLRDRSFDRVRTAMLYRTGLRFRWIGWIVLGLLVATGIANLGFRGFTWADALDGSLWQGVWGRLLAWKVGLVTLVLGGSALHDFYLGPLAARVLDEHPHTPRAERLRRTASYIGRVMLLLSLAILALAVLLVRG
ncbi:MAG: DUF4149 domain-containing protein [Rhodothermales bacterium]